MKTKKIITALLAAVLILLPFSACATNPEQSVASGTQASSKAEESTPVASEKLRVVSTIFPPYDWIREILGKDTGNVELSLLVDDGVDLHSYQPSVEDIAKISTCDMFIYVGGESDGWVHDAVETAANPDMVVINLLELLGDKAKEEEIVEGMEHEHEEEAIDPERIKDRPLSDWAGDWGTVETALESGAMDELLAHQAEEAGTDLAAQKEASAEKWNSDYAKLKITDTAIAFDGAEATYEYAGYKLVESDHGSAVWYCFEAKDAKDAPKYVAFSDHGTGGEDAHEEEHEEEEEEHGLAHFHIRYGNESTEALTSIEGWAPTFFPADASVQEVAEAMGEHGHSHGEAETDEHVWLSLRNAQFISGELAKALGEMDAANNEAYLANAAAYQETLSALDKKYEEAVSSAATKTLLFGDRFPFRYLVDDYNLDYYAAFSGCSAETEASFETIVFLADKVNTQKLKNIMVIETSDKSIANTVLQNTTDKNQNILVLDSMQSVTAQNITAGTTYLTIMESNLEVLRQALS